MKRAFRHLIRQIILFFLSNIGAYHYFRRGNRNKVLIMVYHDVIDNATDCNLNHYNYNTTINKKRFAKQVKYICKHYTPITLSDFISWKIENMQLPPNPVLFTFDDGHTNLYKNALPILDKYNVKGVFFIKSGCMGKAEQNYCEQYLSYYLSYKEGQEKYNVFRSSSYTKQLSMINDRKGNKQYDSVNETKYKHFTFKECKSMLAKGHSLQSHTMHHYILSALEEKDVEAEMSKSKDELEKMFNCNVNCIAYPFGDSKYDFGKREKFIAQKVGYLLAFSGEMKDINGVSHSEDNFSISRFGDVNHDLLYFKLLLSPIRLIK